MVFSSAVFSFLFLPVVILLHTVIKNNKIRNGLLIAASLIFMLTVNLFTLPC